MKRGFLNSSKVNKKPLYEAPEVKSVPGGERPTLQEKEHAAKSDIVNSSVKSKPVEQSTAPQKPGNITYIPAPYGKIGDTALPKDYESAAVRQISQMTCSSANRVDYDDNTFVYTRIPATPSPDGNSCLMIFGPTKRKILETPGYIQPVPKPSLPHSYVVKATPSMGLGVFATRKIEVGELIIAERPLLVAPRAIKTSNHAEMTRKYGAHKANLISMAEWNKLLMVPISGMTPENQDAFFNLTTTHKIEDDGTGPVLGILRTNGFGLYELFDGDKLADNLSNLYTGVVKIGSRFNHSCRPNIMYDFNMASFSFQFTATRDIQEGEQMFYCYVHSDEPVASRRKALAPYSIVCKCPSCVKATPATDKLRSEFNKRIDDVRNQQANWKAKPSYYLDLMLGLRRDILDEGLNGTESYASCLQVIYLLYRLLNQPRKEKIFFEEFKKYNRIAKMEVL